MRLLSFCFLFAVWSVKGFAEPKKLDVIFLSHSYASYLERMINPPFSFYNLELAVTLEQAKKNCVPMGEGCFHPQYGMIIEDSGAETKDSTEDKKVEVKTFNALETNLVDCREKEYFDIFCGKASPESKPAPIQMWVDVSASMRHVDSDVTKTTCYRKSFVKNIITQCPNNSVDISIYNNSLKLLGDHDSLCLSYGMNSPNRFRDWIEASNAEHLFIITDVDEMTPELRDFLDTKGANIIGIGAKQFSVKDLDQYSKDFINTCKKK